MAPTISLSGTFSLSMIIDIGIISIGVMDMMVETMPVGACCTANSESETPMNGPKNDPIEICFMAFLSIKAEPNFPQFLESVITIEKPIIAAIILICVAAIGL